jgi:hypothetical protein
MSETIDLDHTDFVILSRQCGRCKAKFPLSEFALKTRKPFAAGERVTNCSPCMEDKKKWRQGKSSSSRNEIIPSTSELDHDTELGNGDLSELVLGDFLSFLGRQKDEVKIEACVNVGELSVGLGRRERADALAHLMWEMSNYRFL